MSCASSRKRFRRGILRHTTVKELLGLAMADAAVQEQVASRLGLLCAIDSDVYFQHPQDVAIATYLRILDIAAPDFAESLAPLVARLPNTWWARPLAAQLLNLRRTKAASTNEQALRPLFRSVVRQVPSIESKNAADYLHYPGIAGPPRRLKAAPASDDVTQSFTVLFESTKQVKTAPRNLAANSLVPS